MKVVFFGSGRFAAGMLKCLLRTPYAPSLIVTSPPAPGGRGMRLKTSAVDEVGIAMSLPVLRPIRLKDESFVDSLRAAAPDLFLVVDYGRFLTQDLLLLPRLMPVAIHPSLLPSYRGAAPINWVLLKGEEKTGVTFFRVNENMDAGEIIAREEVRVEAEDDYDSLFNKLLSLSCAMAPAVLRKIEAGNVVLREQDETLASFAPKISKEQSRIDWREKASDIYNLVRALRGDGEAWCLFRGRVVKVRRLRLLDEDASAPGGSIVYVDKKNIKVAAADKNLSLEELKPAGKNFMDAASFISGYTPRRGESFA